MEILKWVAIGLGIWFAVSILFTCAWCLLIARARRLNGTTEFYRIMSRAADEHIESAAEEAAIRRARGECN